MTPTQLLRTNSRLAFALVGVLSLLSVAGALYSQHQLGMQPCPWCILQRVIYLAIAFVALMAAAMPAPRQGPGLPAALSAGLIALLGLCGGAAALYQNLVASKLPSCDMTLADKIISGLGLDAWQPEVFEVRASCADAAVKLLGVPYELWSLSLYALFVVVCMILIRTVFMPDSARM